MTQSNVSPYITSSNFSYSVLLTFQLPNPTPVFHSLPFYSLLPISFPPILYYVIEFKI